MKSIKYIVAAAIAASLTVSSYATVAVTWATSSSTYITDSGGAADDGTTLANGDVLEIGTWASLPSAITQGNVQAELSSFEVFGTGSVNLGNGNGFGLASSATAGPTFTGKQIVMIAFDQPTFTVTPGSTQVAIFYTSASNWIMPADSATAATTIDPADLFPTQGSANLASGAKVLFGTADADVENGYSLIDTMTIVPEPSSIALVVMGLLGGFGLIRRRR